MTSMALYIILCYSSWFMNLLLKYLHGRIRIKKPQNRKSTGLKIHQMSYMEYIVSCVPLKTFLSFFITTLSTINLECLSNHLGSLIMDIKLTTKKKKEKLKTIRSQSLFCLKYLNTNYKNEIRIIFRRKKISFIFNRQNPKKKKEKTH